MATGRPPDAVCRIVKHGILELETEAGSEPVYNGVLMFDGMLIVVEYFERNLEFYNGHNGKRITSHRLEYSPNDVCLINKNEVAVCLYNGTVVILSLKSIDDVKLVKTLETGFLYCHSLAKWNSDKLVISGWKDSVISGMRKDFMLCWGILSIRDGRMDSTHDICEGNRTNMAVKDNTLYISCWTFNPINIGVHVCDLSNSQTLKFLYRHQELKRPWSIMADRDYVYVCDKHSNRIHQLTDSGQLVTIHTVSSIPLAIFYDDQHGLLYTTSDESNVITVYKMESLNQQGTAIPAKAVFNVDREYQKEKRQLVFGETRVSGQGELSRKGNISRVKQQAKISPLRPMINVDPVEQVTQRLNETCIHESILRRLSKDLIGKNWRFFFRELSVTDREIQQIEIDFHQDGVWEQIYQLLCRSNEKGILNKDSIMEALKSIDRVDLVTKYKRETFPDS